MILLFKSLREATSSSFPQRSHFQATMLSGLSQPRRMEQMSLNKWTTSYDIGKDLTGQHLRVPFPKKLHRCFYTREQTSLSTAVPQKEFPRQVSLLLSFIVSLRDAKQVNKGKKYQLLHKKLLPTLYIRFRLLPLTLELLLPILCTHIKKILMFSHKANDSVMTNTSFRSSWW